ncbi:MAG TPA: bacillithiol biosynthesis deacetylase BshB2 [Bacillales bacterium]|nr:bacillithiol biosynthesis deacetylase BshB2 [Bacillales bacterium]
MKEHLLVIFPHPDDESFGTAGVIAQHTEKGIPVTYVCATLGEMGRNMGKPPVANRETLPEYRKKELKNACEIMGIQDLRMLGMRDKTLEFEDPEVFADLIGEIIDEVQPTLVVSHYPGYAVHPDHNATGEAVVQAISRMPKEEQPPLHCHAFSANTKEDLGDPDIVVDVRDVLDRKISALKAHGSQTQLLVSKLSEDDPESDPELIKWLGYERFWIYPV